MRWVTTAVLTLAVAGTLQAPAMAAESFLRTPDSIGDARSERGDLRWASVYYGHESVTTRFAVARRTSPRSPNWQYSDYTWTEVLFDTDDDGRADYSARYYNDSRDNLVVDVLRNRNADRVVCSGRGGYAEGVYHLSFHPRCIDHPESLRYRLRLLYDTDASDRDAPQSRDWAPSAGWSAAIVDPTPMEAAYVRISTPPAEVAFGQSVAITGSVERQSDSQPLAGHELVLYSRPQGDSDWELVAQAPTDAQGRTTFQHSPQHNTQYQVRHPGSDQTLPHVSGVPTVKVGQFVDSQMAVTEVGPDEDVVITGLIRPGLRDEWDYWDPRVEYSYQGGQWEDAYADFTMNDDGTFEATWWSWYLGDPGQYQVRVFSPATSDNAAGVGPTHTVQYTVPPCEDEWSCDW